MLGSQPCAHLQVGERLEVGETILDASILAVQHQGTREVPQAGQNIHAAGEAAVLPDDQVAVVSSQLVGARARNARARQRDVL